MSKFIKGDILRYNVINCKKHIIEIVSTTNNEYTIKVIDSDYEFVEIGRVGVVPYNQLEGYYTYDKLYQTDIYQTLLECELDE